MLMNGVAFEQIHMGIIYCLSRSSNVLNSRTSLLVISSLEFVRTLQVIIIRKMREKVNIIAFGVFIAQYLYYRKWIYFEDIQRAGLAPQKRSILILKNTLSISSIIVLGHFCIKTHFKKCSEMSFTLIRRNRHLFLVDLSATG